MNLRLQDTENSSTAATVAPEDLRRGDYVAVLSQIYELPTFLWHDTLATDRGELVRVRRLPTDERVPRKIKAICLPYLFVKLPSGEFETLDVRLATLARLDRRYARKVWKSLKPPQAKPAATTSNG